MIMRDIRQALKTLNLPTRLTLLRLLLVVPLVVLPWIEAIWSMRLALVVMLAAAATDYLDGWAARRYQESTPLGTMLDQIVDKVLVLGALVALLAAGKLSWLGTIVTFLILFREILVSGLRENLALAQVPVPVSPLAKWKTSVQMLALILIYAAHSAITSIVGALDALAEISLVVAGVLTLITAWEYTKVACVHYT